MHAKQLGILLSLLTVFATSCAEPTPTSDTAKSSSTSGAANSSSSTDTASSVPSSNGTHTAEAPKGRLLLEVQTGYQPGTKFENPDEKLIEQQLNTIDWSHPDGARLRLFKVFGNVSHDFMVHTYPASANLPMTAQWNYVENDQSVSCKSPPLNSADESLPMLLAFYRDDPNLPALTKTWTTHRKEFIGAHRALPQRNPNLEWTPFSSAEDSYTVLFPRRPETTRREFSGAIQSTAQCQHGQTMYYVAATHSAPAAYNSQGFDIKHVMDATINSDLQNNNGQLLSDKDIELDGHPGREITFSGTSSNGLAISAIARYYAVDTIVYRLMVSGDRSDADTQKFFDSFKLNGSGPNSN